MYAGHLQSMLPIVVMVIVSEVFVDCVKHAFITKFNNISPDVYKTYRLTLAKDLTDSRSKRVIERYLSLCGVHELKYSGVFCIAIEANTIKIQGVVIWKNMLMGCAMLYLEEARHL